MRYKVILTHNPQDFFDGTEPQELTESLDMDTNSPGWFIVVGTMFAAINQGYKAIIYPKEEAP